MLKFEHKIIVFYCAHIKLYSHYVNIIIEIILIFDTNCKKSIKVFCKTLIQFPSVNIWSHFFLFKAFFSLQMTDN